MESNADPEIFGLVAQAPGQGTDLLILSEAARQALGAGRLDAPQFHRKFALGGGRFKCTVSVSEGAQAGLARVAFTVVDAGTGRRAAQLEGEVRRSWVEDVVEAARDCALPAVAIASAVAEIAVLPGQSAVRVTVAEEVAGPGEPLVATLGRLLGAPGRSSRQGGRGQALNAA